MDIKCGHCKRHHSAIAEVKECAAETVEQIENQQAEARVEATQERAIENRAHWDSLA